MMESSRKRPSSPVEDGPALKKRALVSATDSPTAHANGATTPDPEASEDINLEGVRKEAIYRRMRHYAREHERDQRRIDQLQAAKTSYLVGMKAIEACWNLLISEICAIVPSCSDLDSVPIASGTLEPPEPEDDDVSAFEAALSERREATSKLVGAFVAHAGNAQVDMVTVQIARRKATSEAQKHRSEVEVLRKQLEEVESQLFQTRQGLQAAENRAFKLRREALSAPTPQRLQPPDETQELPTVKAEERQPSPSPAEPIANGHSEDDKLPEHTDHRQALEDERVEELARLRAKVRDLEEVRKLLSEQLEEGKKLKEETIKDSKLYRQLESDKADSDRQWKEALAANDARSAAAEELHTFIAKLKEQVEERQTQHDDYLTEQIKKYQFDATRLRDARDAALAQFTENKALLDEKLTSVEACKSAVDVSQKRIAALEFGIRRLKAQMAARVGDEDIFKFFISENEDPSYVASLRERLTAAEDKIKCREEVIAAKSQDDSHDAIQAEIAAREALQAATRRLAQYEKLYGPEALSAASQDVQALVAALKAKELALAESELLRSNDVDSINALGDETDRLMSLVAELEEHSRATKLKEVVEAEEKLNKLTVEKAKADNKYFAAMRAKDFADAEAAKMKAVVEKSTQNAQASRELYLAANTTADQLLTELKQYQEQLSARSTEADRLAETNKMFEAMLKSREAEINQLRERVDRTGTTFDGRQKEVDGLKKELATSKDALADSQARLDKLERARKTNSAATLESDSYADALAMLKCSTCKNGWRDYILVKCGHTFCKPCIDARISTRQRKCPACGNPFAQSEVLQMFRQ